MSLRRFAVLALLASCAVPQDIEEPEPGGPQGNQAPRIVSRSPIEDVLDRSVSCPDLILELQVIEDFDPEDDLEVRWFVDYDDGNVEPFDSSVIPGGDDVINGVRTPPGDTFELDLRDLRGRTVVVSAVVSDGFDDPEKEPRWQAVLPGRDSDRTNWTVHVPSTTWGACE